MIKPSLGENKMRRHSVLWMIGFFVVASASLNAETRRTLFPQIAVGGEWSSDLYLTNQGFSPIQGVTVSFFRDNGQPKVVQASGLGSGSTFTLTLAAGQTRVIALTGGDAGEPQGYAEFTSPTPSDDELDNTLRATLIVRFAPGGVVQTQLGVPEQYPFSHFSFAAEVSPGISTGIAVANSRLGAQVGENIDLVISLVGEDGTYLQTVVRPLPEGRHEAFFLDNIFPAVTNFKGTVTISGPDWFGALALRLEAGALGTVAVNEGIILKPFLLGLTPTNETTANNNTLNAAQAITLPVVIAGGISDADDRDYFRFTAQQGDIVNIFASTSTTPTRSILDTEIFLYDAQGGFVAWNDQNGVRGVVENDSLIRAVIPATGTYYIRLWDFFGTGGGSEFTYRLHVRLENQ
jgi:hypothetical protein